MNKPKNKTEKYIAISDIALNLGLLDSDIEKWLSEESPTIKLDHRKRKSVSSFYLESLSRDSRYEKAKRKSLESENSLRESETKSKKKGFKLERKHTLERYSNYILELEGIHRSCLNRVNFHHHESAIAAAYLLLSKAISCLKLGVLSLENGYWYGGSIIREIDETLDLAHYFTISKNTDQGKNHIHQWFRHNYAPRHAECRKAISKHFSKLTGSNACDHQELMNELYQKKSKFSHPTYSSIREVTHFDTSSGIEIASIEYGTISFEMKIIELAHYFQSSIWSAFQCFQISDLQDYLCHDNCSAGCFFHRPVGYTQA